MIQQELRIGNWVEKKQHSPLVYGKVTQVYMDGFTVDYHYPGGWYAPIQLDESILLKAGFNKDDEYFKFRVNNEDALDQIILIWRDGVFMIEQITKDVSHDVVSIQAKIAYLHQLQNITFALTGTELIINLEAQP